MIHTLVLHDNPRISASRWSTHQCFTVLHDAPTISEQYGENFAATWTSARVRIFVDTQLFFTNQVSTWIPRALNENTNLATRTNAIFDSYRGDPNPRMSPECPVLLETERLPASSYWATWTGGGRSISHYKNAGIHLTRVSMSLYTPPSLSPHINHLHLLLSLSLVDFEAL